MNSKNSANAKRILKSSALILGSIVAVAGVESVTANTVSASTFSSLTAGISSSQSFINSIAEYARKLASDNDLYASVMIAQAGLESGWGNSTLSQAPYNNLFGIKGQYKGNTANFNTLEDNGSGNYYQINDGFRVYPSVKESLQDYAYLLRNGLTYNKQFYSGAWKSNTNSYKDATAFLTGRYATDTRYGSKLNSIIQTYNLTKYDTPAKGNNSNNINTSSSNTTTTSKPGSKVKSYTVKPGDGLYKVAAALGTTIDAIKAKYGLTSNLIHPGQVFTMESSSPKGSTNNSENTSKKESNTSTNKTSTTTTSKKSYTVKPGDGLLIVARELGTTVSAIKAKYGLTSNLIHPGQVFTMESSNSSLNSATDKTTNSDKISSKYETSSTKTPTAKKSYTVKPGDGLLVVARELGTTVGAIKAKYGLTSNLIFPGQVFTMDENVSAKVNNNQPVAKATKAEVKQNTAVTIESEKTTTTSPSTTTNYIVQSGDTVSSIAQAHNMTNQELMQLNSMYSTFIYLGQQLKVKGAQTVIVTPSSASTESAVVTTRAEESSNHVSDDATKFVDESKQVSSTHKIKAGESLYRIAIENGVSLNALLSANGLKNNSLILPGQVLVIPA